LPVRRQSELPGLREQTPSVGQMRGLSGHRMSIALRFDALGQDEVFQNEFWTGVPSGHWSVVIATFGWTATRHGPSSASFTRHLAFAFTVSTESAFTPWHGTNSSSVESGARRTDGSRGPGHCGCLGPLPTCGMVRALQQAPGREGTRREKKGQQREELPGRTDPVRPVLFLLLPHGPLRGATVLVLE